MLSSLALLLLVASAPEPGASPSLTPPSARALLANSDGLKALRKGRPADAIAPLVAALAESPGYDMARYNLVCARALRATGPDLDLAAADLTGLLSRDFMTFGPRWASDPDLAALRSSPHAQALDALAANLARTWAEVRARGVFGLLVHRRPPAPADDVGDYRGLDHVAATRVGLYDPVSRRFFATAPPVKGVVAARHADAFTQLFGVDFDFCTVDFCPRAYRHSSWIFTPDSKNPVVSRVLHRREHDFSSDLFVALAENGAWLNIPGATAEPGPDEHPDTYRPHFVWVGLSRAPTPDPRPPLPKTTTLEIDFRGVLGPPTSAPGFSLEQGVLTTPSGSVDLGFRHRRDTRTLIFADASTALVLSNRDVCVCGGEFQGAVFWSGLSVVDLKTHKVVHHQHQEASATAVVTSSGVYVQLGDRVTRYQTLAEVASSSGEALPEQFALELLPMTGRYCCGH